MPGKLPRPALAPLALLLATLASPAGAGNFAVGAKVGTGGIGIEGTLGISERLNLRAGYYAFNYGTDITENDIEYDGDLRLRNAALFADWHPFKGRFRLSIGGVQTGNEFLGSAEGLLDVGDDTYDARLDAKVGWSGFAPYVGLGLGNAVGSKGRLSFSLDLGVMFTGSPNVRLTGTVDDPALQAQFAEDLAREQADLAEELKDVKFYPLLALGFAYRF